MACEIHHDFTEINVPEGIIQKIDYEISLADITVDLENGDKIHSNFRAEEINMERLSYLLNVDDMLEEMLSQDPA